MLKRSDNSKVAEEEDGRGILEIWKEKVW